MNKLFTTLLFSLFLNCSFAQIVATTNGNGNQLSQMLAGRGVTISNVVMNCPGGAAGMFQCNNCNLGMDSGIVLTTGSDTIVQGPNGSGSAGLDNMAPGDASLNTLAQAVTHDACSLEFDMNVSSDSVEFRYVFGSEEYLEWVNAGYNDAFAFFISGPGIVGQQNIALVPGTNTPVTIDNVNTGSYPQYYVDNGDGYSAPQNASNTYIQYDGFTTVLTAKRKNLQPCQVYHLKLVIADGGDGIYDSGVFLEANSLTSNYVSIDTAETNVPNVTNAMEGCVQGVVRFRLQEPVNHPTVVHYQIHGTATNNVDYSHIADSITIPTGDTIASLFVNPISDGIIEGTETVVISLHEACSNLAYDSAVLLIIDSFGVSAGPDVSICAGDQALLNGVGLGLISWSPSATLTDASQAVTTASPATTTTYTITADLGVCQSTDQMTVNILTPPFSVNAGPNITSCSGTVQLNAVVTGSMVNGNPFVYAWTPASGLSATNIANPTATPSGSTSYEIQVSSGGCRVKDTVTVTAGSMTVSASATNETCPGSHNGTATATATGVSPFSYAWSNSGTTQTITGLGVGNYTIVVTDNTGCTGSASATVGTGGSLNPAATATNETCFGLHNGTATATANGSAPYIYNWSNSGTSQTITGLTPGNFTVTVTDNGGCSGTASVSVAAATAIVFNAPVITPVKCFGNTDGRVDVSATGGTGAISYLWSTGITGASATSLAANTPYTVSVTDANGCHIDTTFNLPAPPANIASATATNETCSGSADGSASASSTGISPFAYNWSNTGNTQTINGLTAGNYMVTVTDNIGCTATASALVSSNTLIVFNTPVITAVKCFGGSDGQIDITATGGAGTMNYSWNTGGTGSTAAGLAANTPYTVSAADANGCHIDTTIVLPSPTQVNVNVTSTNITCNPGGSGTSITPNAGHDGTATASATGGAGGYSYLWNTVAADVTPAITNQTAGTYAVVVTDANGCIASDSATLTEPQPMSVTASSMAPLCIHAANGSVTAACTGGTPSYMFTVSFNSSPVQTNNTGEFTGLAAGDYVISVSDAHSCVKIANLNLPDPGADILNVSTKPVSCAGAEYTDGTIIVTPVSILNQPYLYSLDGGGNQQLNEFYNVSAGTHRLHIINNNGCTTDTTVMVAQPAAATLEIIPGDTTIQLGASIQLNTAFSSFASDSEVIYSWSANAGLTCTDCANPVVNSYDNRNDYTLTVTYNGHCKAVATAKVNVTGTPAPFIPNAFTPNGDGNNDVFMVYGEGIRAIELKVFNRWGEMVYESNNQFDGWDGTYKGQLQNTNVYVYEVTTTFLDGKKADSKGTVTLIR